ncbi:hypothetical protein ACQP3F_33240, partial [Escherichia coli]
KKKKKKRPSMGRRGTSFPSMLMRQRGSLELASLICKPQDPVSTKQNKIQTKTKSFNFPLFFSICEGMVFLRNGV